MKRLIIDIESNNLLQPALDYSELPYRLNSDYQIHCIVVRDIDTNAVQTLVQSQCSRANLTKILDGCTEIIGHNLIGFDLPVLMLMGLLDYRVGYPGEPSTINNQVCEITDTLLWSKLLNADRFNGHSLGAWGRRLRVFKGDYDQWEYYTPQMLEYCIQDTKVTSAVYDALIEEQGANNWGRAYSMESKLADLTLRQEVFGFEFDKELAEKNLTELSEIMQGFATKVDPLLPPKILSKVKLDYYTPPKNQIKKDGNLTVHMQKFIERHNLQYVEWMKEVMYEGKVYQVPFSDTLKTTEVASIEDIDTVKSYLMGLGWVPSEVKERDLVKKIDKSKKTYAEIVETIDRYVEQTKHSVFQQLRLDIIGCSIDQLRTHLVSKIDNSKPIYVPTTPKLTVGLEKEICPNLIELGEKAEFAKDVVHYYTYRHRKNSISGGVTDEDGEPMTGFMSAVREDGRIPTPADTLGANTGRYRHKVVCNVPRVTSLYGEQMRNLFRAGKGLWQLGYDFASLEARVMGHYVLPYTDGEALATALIAEKPNDIHSINARKLGIDRSSAKSFSYAAIYGAQPKKLAKMLGVTENEAKKLFNDYWDAVPALKELKDKVEKVWEQSGKTTIPGLDGRLLNTRSKHSLINVLFQSGGAICAKWSAVRLAQAMEREGILGDPFIHSRQDKKVWWLIHMHDEQQMAVHPSLLDVKAGFQTEAEAKAVATEGGSAIGHGAKGYYVGNKTLPITCIEEGINTAVDELKLRVKLGFEWIPGSNWGQCH